jgi:hypothetical protein
MWPPDNPMLWELQNLVLAHRSGASYDRSKNPTLETGE